MGYFIGKNYFEEDGTYNYLAPQPIIRCFKVNTIISVANYTLSWQSKGLRPTTSDNSLTPTTSYYYAPKIRVKFTGSCLKQSKNSYIHRNIVNIYTFSELGVSGANNSDPTLKNCLFGAVTLTKNTDFDKYGYSGYGIGSDRRSSVSFPGDRIGQNVLIFRADMSSSALIDNKKKDILVLGKGPT